MQLRKEQKGEELALVVYIQKATAPFSSKVRQVNNLSPARLGISMLRQEWQDGRYPKVNN